MNKNYFINSVIFHNKTYYKYVKIFDYFSNNISKMRTLLNNKITNVKLRFKNLMQKHKPFRYCFRLDIKALQTHLFL